MRKFIALASLALAFFVAAPAMAQTLTKSQKALEKEQAKIAQKAQKEADKVAAKAAKETEKINKQATKDAEKAAKKQAEKVEKEAKKQAEKAAAKAEKEAKKAAKEAEKKAVKEAEKAAKKAEKEAEKAAKKAEKEALKATEKNAKKMEKAADKLNKATEKAEKAAKQIVPVPTVPAIQPKTDGTTGATPSEQKKTPIRKPTPSISNTADTVAYFLGIYQSSGLKPYMQQQLGVDTTYMADFIEGIYAQLDVDPADKAFHARQAGMQVGQQIQKMAENVTNDILFADKGEKADVRLLTAGIVEGLTGTNAISSQDAMTKFNQIAEKRRAEKDEIENGPNRKAGEEFLAQNKSKDGVVTLPSGLQYKVLTKGKGATPKATDRVKVNYEGHLIDGTEFDSSYKRNEPATFGVNQVIKGWTEALCLMPVGSKWELYIPQELAYGSRKTGNIPPYSTLIFTVELLDIVK